MGIVRPRSPIIAGRTVVESRPREGHAGRISLLNRDPAQRETLCAPEVADVKSFLCSKVTMGIMRPRPPIIEGRALANIGSG